MNKHLLRRLFVLAFVLSWLLIPLSLSQTAGASDTDTEFHSAAVVIAQSGKIGHYILPEPPGYPPVKCATDGAPTRTDIQPTSYLSVTASDPSYTGQLAQKVDVTPGIAQRLPDGSFTKVVDGTTVWTTANGSIPAWVWTNELLSGPVGPDLVYTYTIVWYAPNTNFIIGIAVVAYSHYHRWIAGSPQTFPDSSVCGGQWAPMAETSTTTGLVGTKVDYTIVRFPLNVAVPITWDGKPLGTAYTNSSAVAAGNFKIPASPMGNHTIRWKYGHWDTKITYTVKPSIKLSPNSNLLRGQIVHVYLRGYAAHETVNVRWIKNGSFVKIAQVTTSGSGTANVDVHVPKWVPNGSTSVRGDGTSGHAQTNSVTVSGGPFSSSTVKTPTPTPTKIATPSATPTATTTPVMPTATETTAASPEPSATATSELSDTPTEAPPTETPATATPTEPAPTETGTAQPDPPSPTFDPSTPTPGEA